MKKVSIVVPIYNAEETLNRCLDSLINQSYKNIEIVCVNDGSSDSSLKILNEYHDKDNRIVVIDNDKNRGCSFTKNRGIDNATGEFICFVDSDDYVESNMVYELVKFQKENNLDLVKCHYNNYEDGKLKNTILNYQEEKILNTKKDINEFKIKLFSGEIPGYLQLLLIKKSVLNNKRINEKITFLEDITFYLDLLSEKIKVGILNKRLYNYVNNKNGLTFSLSTEKIENRIKGIIYFYERALLYSETPKQKQVVLDRCTYLIVHSLFELYRVTKNNKNLIVEYMKDDNVKEILDKSKEDNLDRFSSIIIKKYKNKNIKKIWFWFNMTNKYLKIKECLHL